MLVVVLVPTSFLMAGAAPSSAGPRGATIPPLGLALPPSAVSLVCLFFFLAILKSRLWQVLGDLGGARAQGASAVRGEEAFLGAS